MGEQGDRRIRPTRGRRTVRAHREQGRARRALAMLLMVGALASSVVLSTASPASAAGAACAAAELKPSLRELMVSQGLASYPALVQGKETLVRLFLSKPSCASTTQTVTVTGTTLSVVNTSAVPAAALGSGSKFSPTGSFDLPAYYTGTPPANSSTDPVFTVKGNVLASDVAGFNATFSVTLSYTATGVIGTQTATFQATKAVAQKSNPLRMLVVPMGDANQLRSTQYSASADAAVQQGVNALSRVLPVPCNADPADPNGACVANSLLSSFGGVRYAVSPGIVNMRAIPGAYTTDGKFCGGQSNWDAIKATLAQFLQSWNTANPLKPADRVMGVVDEAISYGAATSPVGYNCADGMAATGSVAAWSRAMYASQPSRSGGIFAMELVHTFGGVPSPRSNTTHSSNTSADGTAPGRAYNVTQRAHIANSRSVMQYDTTSAWNNDTTLLEKADEEFMLCHLGGPPNTECATSGKTGVITGADAGITVVASGTTRYTAETTKVVTSYVTNDVAQDPAGADLDSSTRLVIFGPSPAIRGISVSSANARHDPGANNENVSEGTGLFSFALPGEPGMTGFAIVHCPTGTDTCKADPTTANGGVVLYERYKQSSPTVLGATSYNAAGDVRNWTNDPSRDDTNPAVNNGAVAWVARCGACPSGATTVHLAPVQDVTKVVEVPLNGTAAQIDPVWRSDGAAVAWSAAGDLYTALVNRSVTPYAVSDVKRIYAQGTSNPAAMSPSWGLDKSTIYFCASNGGIRSVPAAGGKSSPLVATSAKECQPSASQTPGDRRLTYTKGTDVWIVDPSNPSKTQKLLITNADQSWFGDDGRVIVRQNGKLASLKSDGTDLKQLTAGQNDANPSASGGTLGFDRLLGDREVMLADLAKKSVTATFTGPDASRVVGELRLTCVDGSVHPVAVGVPPYLQSSTQGTFEQTYDESGACGGPAQLQWVCSDGFDPCVSGASSQLTVNNSNKGPVPAITSPAVGLVISPTGALALNGSASSQQGQLSGSSLQWFASGPGLSETPVGSGNAFDLPAPAGGWPTGTLTIRLQATDAGGRTDSATRQVTVDGDTPQVTISSEPTNPDPSSTATFTYSATDTGGSSQTTTVCQLDDGPKVSCPPSVTYSNLSQGEHTWTVTSTDEAGNATTLTRTWVVDFGPPTTTASVSPPSNAAGWHNANPTVTLTAVDGVGVASITYSLTGAQTGGETVPGDTASFTITTEGITTVQYYATDTSGQVEAPKQLTVKLDRTPAETVINEPPSLICVGCQLTGRADDTGSGVTSVTVHFRPTIGGAATDRPATCGGCGPGVTSATWSVDTSGLVAGIYNVTATSADLAGNPGATSNQISSLKIN